MKINIIQIPSEYVANHRYSSLTGGRLTHGVRFDSLKEYQEAVRDWARIANKYINRLKRYEDIY
jgi:hypothetical protein